MDDAVTGNKSSHPENYSAELNFDKNSSDEYELDQSSILSTVSDTGICPKEVSINDKTPNVPSQAALSDVVSKQEFDQKILELRQEFMSKYEAKMSNGMNDVRAVSGTTYWSGDESSSKIGSFIEESEIRQLAECRDIIENTPVLRGALAGKTKLGLRENTEKDLSENVAVSVKHCNAFAETCDKPEAVNESSKNTARDLDLTLKRQETEKQSEGHQIDSLQMNGSSVEELHVKKDKLSHRNRNKGELETAFDQRIVGRKAVLFGLAAFLLLGFALFGLAWFFTGLGLKLAQENSKGLTHYIYIKQRRKTKSDLELAQEKLEEFANYKATSQREIEDLRNSLDAEIKQKTESEFKLAYENSKNFRHDKASAHREIEDLPNSLYVEMKERLKAESELKLAQENLEELRGEKDKAENDLKRVVWIYSTLIVVGLVGLAKFGAQKYSIAKNELSREIEQRSKVEGELELTQEDLKGLRLDNAKAEQATKDLQNSLDAEIEQRRKTESELKLVQENIEGMRLDKDKAENELQRNLEEFANYKATSQREIEDLQKSFDGEIQQRRKTMRKVTDLQNSLDAELQQRRKTESDLELAQEKLEELFRDKNKAENDLKRKIAEGPFARSDVVIVKSEMNRRMRNHAIGLMIASMKECTCAADVTKFITGKMREKYGSEWICFISDGKPNPIVLDNQYFLGVYLKMDVINIELIA